ncbi:MAG: AAA family ATPase, partial [Bacteroidia bacterium]
MENFETRIDLSSIHQTTEALKHEIGKYIIGQHQTIDLLLMALLADGHVLIEGVPGVAKTLMTKLLAKTIDAQFKRIQFTPDLMPSDVIGTMIYNAKNNEFEFKRGPLFANIVLTDEINRAPAKTQAALFEAMEERQITVDGTTHILDSPFMVLATQNPIEQEGTYRLPEAQLDRFLFKIEVGYPTLEEEKEILKTFHLNKNTIDFSTVKSFLNANTIASLRNT